MKYIYLPLLLICSASEASSVSEITKVLNGASSKWETLDKTFCQPMQPNLYYQSPELYSSIIEVPQQKAFKSIGVNGEYGTIMYFEFTKPLSKSFKEFMTGLIYGSDKPSKHHPVEISFDKNMFFIWCFNQESKIKSELKVKLKI